MLEGFGTDTRMITLKCRDTQTIPSVFSRKETNAFHSESTDNLFAIPTSVIPHCCNYTLLDGKGDYVHPQGRMYSYESVGNAQSKNPLRTCLSIYHGAKNHF